MLLLQAFEFFRENAVTHIEIFTFPQSPKHQYAYSKFGLYPGYLIHLMRLTVDANARQQSILVDSSGRFKFERMSDGHTPSEQFLETARSVTNEVYKGLDLSPEMRAMLAGHITGDAVLLREEGRQGAVGVMALHYDKKSEADDDYVFIKVACALTREALELLVDLAIEVAQERAAHTVEVGVNLVHLDLHRYLASKGFKTARCGLSMQWPPHQLCMWPNLLPPPSQPAPPIPPSSEPAVPSPQNSAAGRQLEMPATLATYNRPDVFMLADWR